MPVRQALIWTRTNTYVMHADTLILVLYIYVKYRIDIMRYIACCRYRDILKILSTLISRYLENIAW